MVQHRHERPGPCGHHSLTTTTDARACRAIIPIPPALAQLAHADPLQHAESQNLLGYLASVPDPRGPRGRRHPLIAILAMAAAAVLAGARSMTAIAEWAADAPQPVWAALGARRDAPTTGPSRSLDRFPPGPPGRGRRHRRVAGRPGPRWPAAACPGGRRQDAARRQTRRPPGPPARRDGTTPAALTSEICTPEHGAPWSSTRSPASPSPRPALPGWPTSCEGTGQSRTACTGSVT